MDIPELNTPRLNLRGICEGDIACYTKHFVDYEVIRFLAAAVPWPYPADGVRDYLLNKILPFQGDDRWMWGIYEQDSPGELIGAVELWRPGQPENRGFWLGKQFWGRGYMTEAVVPVTDLAFDALGFAKLIFSNAKGNERSRRIKVKTGAKLLRLEPAKFVDPNFTESEIWELTNDEWARHKTKPE